MSSYGLQFLSYIVQNIHSTTWNQVFQYESKSLQDLHKPLVKQPIEFIKMYLYLELFSKNDGISLQWIFR